mmetsp:Transcript_19544/g.56024  ORF Transcript_19544/g.56024 Transcript_19544/m.56024 type:complete len:315 (+) Transcript_19544:221-1165(+)
MGGGGLWGGRRLDVPAAPALLRLWWLLRLHLLRHLLLLWLLPGEGRSTLCRLHRSLLLPRLHGAHCCGHVRRRGKADLPRGALPSEVVRRGWRLRCLCHGRKLKRRLRRHCLGFAHGRGQGGASAGGGLAHCAGLGRMGRCLGRRGLDGLHGRLRCCVSAQRRRRGIGLREAGAPFGRGISRIGPIPLAGRTPCLRRALLGIPYAAPTLAIAATPTLAIAKSSPLARGHAALSPWQGGVHVETAGTASGATRVSWQCALAERLALASLDRRPGADGWPRRSSDNRARYGAHGAWRGTFGAPLCSGAGQRRAIAN